MKGKKLSQIIKKYREGSTVMPTYVPDKKDILSRGMKAQDYRDESMTDYALGKVPPVPQDVVAKKADTKQPDTTVVKKDSTYNLVPGGTKAVAEYQEMLKSKGLYDGNIDGAWGPKTQAAYESLMKKTPAKTSGSKTNVAVDQKKKEVVIPKTFDPATKNQKNEILPNKVDDSIAKAKNAVDILKDTTKKLIEGNRFIQSNVNQIEIDKLNREIAILEKDDSDFTKSYSRTKDEENWWKLKNEILDKKKKLILKRDSLLVPKSYKKGGIVRMQTGGVAGDPPKGRRYRGVGSKEEIFIEGEDGNLYFSGNNGKSYGVASPDVKDTFYGQLESQKQPNGRLMWSVEEAGNTGVGNEPRTPIVPLPKLPTRKPLVVSGRKYIDNRFVEEPSSNPGLTTDPTSYGPEIITGASSQGNSGDMQSPPSNPGLPTDSTYYGPEITPSSGSMYDTLNPAQVNPDSDNTFSNPENSAPEDVIGDRLNEIIDERKKDVIDTAEKRTKEYEDLADRMGARNLQSLVVSTAGRLLQNRRHTPFIKRPNFIDRKYRGLSAQRINAETEAATGAGVEMVKQMNSMSGGTGTLTARLAPILMSRLVEGQGKQRAEYVKYNEGLERAKYGELGNIIDHNTAQLADQKNRERDYDNKTIAGSAQDVSKFIQSVNQTDSNLVDTKAQIDDKRRGDLYKLDNALIDYEFQKMDYDQQNEYLQSKIADIENELSVNSESLDDASKEVLRKNQEAYQKMLQKNKIKNVLSGQ